MDDGFLFEPCDPRECSWVADAPWVKANHRHRHEYYVRAPGWSLPRCHTYLSAPSGKDTLRQLFYGVTPKELGAAREMLGLSEMFCTTDATQRQNTVNVFDAKGDGGASGWLIAWSLRGCYMVSPDGEPASYGSESAIVVADWRMVARIANIDVHRSRDFSLMTLFLTALGSVPYRGKGTRPMFYVNRDVFNALVDEGLDRDRPLIHGVWVRVVDELHNDEPRVT
ncbi:MAG TPA: hypothetical protein VKS24_24940 [Bradyrhizobium sp.]|nr:hypothetical protein [Bradyrhizobium sp.]